MTDFDDTTIATNTAAEFSCFVSLSNLGTEKTHITLRATPDERAALTDRLGVVAIKELSLDAILKISSPGDVVAQFNMKACVEQCCCVTLDPVHDSISVSYTVTYRDSFRLEQDSREEIFEDIDDLSELPEAVLDGKIDICEVALEKLALEINPFPRVKGVSFDGFTAGPRNANVSKIEKVSPFAALSKLKS